nr:hypothetical protein [Micromonospora sp. DSM 115978]
GYRCDRRLPAADEHEVELLWSRPGFAPVAAGTARLDDHAAFTASLVVPLTVSTGTWQVSVTGGAYDECDDTDGDLGHGVVADCVGYFAEVAVG